MFYRNHHHHHKNSSKSKRQAKKLKICDGNLKTNKSEIKKKSVLKKSSQQKLLYNCSNHILRLKMYLILLDVLIKEP